MESISCRTRSGKRNYSQMTGNSEKVCGQNFDILECFPFLLCQLVFQHFDAKELLEMSIVRQKWNEFVGERPHVGKLKLFSESRDQTDPSSAEQKILLKSGRRYQNIQIYAAYNEAFKFLFAILDKNAGSWKKVRIDFGNTKAPSTWVEILRKVEPSVEAITLDDLAHASENSDAPLDLAFPRLKLLDCFCVSSPNIYKHFCRVASLVKISFYLPSEDASTALDLLRVLRNNKHCLEEMSADLLDWSFFERLSEIKFKLKRLQIEDREEAVSPQQVACFVKTQAETLESLELPIDLEKTFLELILGFPRLTSLKISTISGQIQKPIPVNTTITHFDYKGTSLNNAQALIKAMPNLKHLKCGYIDNELFLFLFLDCPHLQSIGTSCFDVRLVPERNIFPNIKDFKAHSFYNMQEPTADHNFANLVRRELRAYKMRLDYYSQ